MALGRRREVFVPVVDQTDRSPRFAGEQRRMDRHNRGILFLAPKPTPSLGLDDHGLLISQLQRPLESSVDVIGTLE